MAQTLKRVVFGYDLVLFKPELHRVKCHGCSISFFKKTNEGTEASSSHESDEKRLMKYSESLPSGPSKTYTPQGDVSNQVLSIAKQYIPSATIETAFTENFQKLQILSRCTEKFDFPIPSCVLGSLNSLSDLVDYYSVKREEKSPEDKLKEMDLPSNVKLMLEPFRFTEETKDLFGGRTAFPERDTIVTSLKYRNVYKGYKNPPSYKHKTGFEYY